MLPVVPKVSQGSVLGPTLFILYINNIVTNTMIKQRKIRLYADNVLFYHDIKSKPDYIESQDDLIRLNTSADKWKMQFNPVKSHVILFEQTYV